LSSYLTMRRDTRLVDEQT
ncbi:hypothetical protein VCHC55B2_0374B, partial [Vibrio cholerae HC-55B2]